MIRYPRLEDLLSIRQSNDSAGRDVPIAELCRFSPELAGELERPIGVLRRAHTLADPASPADLPTCQPALSRTHLRVRFAVVVIGVLTLGLGLPLWAEPPEKLTAEQRQELEAKWKELSVATVQAYRKGQLPEATKTARETLAVARQLYPREEYPDGHRDLALSLNGLGVLLQSQGKYAEAEPFSRDALAMFRRLHGRADHPQLALSMSNLGVLLHAQGKDAEAETFFRDALAMRQRLSGKTDQPELVQSLNDLGLLLQSQGKYAEAEPFFRDALAMRQRLHGKADHPALAFCLNNLGTVLQSQGKYAEAETCLRDALSMKQRLFGKADHPDLALGLNNLGVLLKNQGKNAEAEPFFRDALAMRRRLHGQADHPELATSLNNLGSLLGAQGKNAEAETFLRDALAMYRRLFGKADHPQLAHSLNDLGVLLQDQGKYMEAEPLYRDALAMYQRLHGRADHPQLAGSLDNLGNLLGAQGKYAEAETFFRDALAMNQRLHGKADHPDLAKSLLSMGGLLRDQGKVAEAETFCRAALAMNQRLHGKADHLDVARSLHNLGGLLRDQGKYAEAETFCRAALAMNQRLHGKTDHPDLVLSRDNLGLLLEAQGKYAEAEPFHRAALAMGQRLYGKADHPYLASSLNNLGSLLQAQGRYAEAEPLYRDALAMRQRLYGKADHPDLATSLNNLGTLLHYQGRYAEAEPFYRAALTLRRRFYGKSDHPDLAKSLHNLGGLLKNQGKNTEAEPFFRDALTMQQRLYGKADHPELANGLHSLGGLLWSQGRYAEAEPFYRDALAMYQRLHGRSDHPDLVISLESLGGLLYSQGKYGEAEPFCRAALAMDRRLGDLYAGARSDGAALTLLATLPRTRDCSLSNARLGRLDPDPTYAAVWDSKAALARVFERRHLAARAAAADPRAAALLDQVAEARRRRADLILALQPADPATRQKRVADLKELTGKVRQLEADLRPLLPTVPRLEKLAGATPTDLRQALSSDAAVVDFLAYTFLEQDPDKPGEAGLKRTPSYLAFVLTRDKVVRVELGPAEPIDKAVVLWREALTGPGKEVPADLPREVRLVVWDKIRPQLPRGVKTLYLCPDSTLTQLPWAALPGDKPGTILLEDHALAVLPHAPFLLDKLWPDDPRPEGRQRPEGVLAVGGVAYDAEPRPSSALAKRGDPPLKPGQPLKWTTLQGAEAEARGVTGAATKQLDTRLLDGDKATASAVLEALPRARFAHLATHGFFADKDFRSVLRVDSDLFKATLRGERIGAGALSPMVMSGLVFAGANKAETPGRGVVTGEALIDLDLSGLDLAVLSACETGLGDVADGQGVFGLQRAFHVAGTRNVVASLWQVHDEATAALMALFYRNLWDKEMPPIEALRQAQLEIYRNPSKIPELAKGWRGKFEVVPGAGLAEGDRKPEGGKAHPRLWAAFTLSGPGTLSTTRP